MQELESCRHHQITNQTTTSENSNVTRIDKKRLQHSDISDQIKSKLAELRIDLNTTLTKLIKSSPEYLVLHALAALKEGMASGEVSRPGGWLNKAIKDGWKPNEKHLPQNQVERDIFKEWFDLAYQQKLVLASTKGKDGQIYIYTRMGVAIPFEKMLTDYPLKVLRVRRQ
jgi:hypothetical protein